MLQMKVHLNLHSYFEDIMLHYESIVLLYCSNAIFVKMHMIIDLSLPADDIGGQFGGPAPFSFMM